MFWLQTEEEVLFRDGHSKAGTKGGKSGEERQARKS